MDKRLDIIEILRALAATSVVIFHAGFEVARQGGVAFFHAGAAGVDLFFIISGFVMVYATENNPRVTWETFLAGRIARILPLYWAATGLFLSIALIAPSLTRREFDLGYIVASFLFWPAADQDGVASPFLGLGWTLNYEMMFYVVFAFALWTRRDKLLIVGAFFAAAFVVRSLFELPTALAFWSDPIILEFMAGMIIARLYASSFRLNQIMGAALIVTGALCILLAPSPPLHRVLAWGAPAAILATGAILANWRLRGRVTRWLITLGGASYALYLTHWFVLETLRVVAPKAGLSIAEHPFLYTTAALALSFVAALMVRMLFEKPATALLKHFLVARVSRPMEKPRQPAQLS